MLTVYKKRTRLDISRYLLSRYEDDPSYFIKRVVTQDETWIHRFDQESKMQSKQWKHPGSPTPKKFKKVHSAGKVMASIFWDCQGLIMIDYLEQGPMINGAYHAGKLRRLCQEGEENWLVVFCSCRTTPLPTHHKLPWLLWLNVGLKAFLIPHILLIWLLLTSICFQNWNPILVVHSMEAMKAP